MQLRDSTKALLYSKTLSNLSYFNQNRVPFKSILHSALSLASFVKDSDFSEN